MISDNGFIDRLAQKLSSAVDNRSVRLVSTGISQAQATSNGGM